jgi:hypothetical protein
VSYSRRELYALGEPLGESVTVRKNGHTIYGGGDGGGSAPTSQTVTQTNVPDYLRADMESLMGRAKTITEQPYQVYSGQRIAGFDPLQQMAYQGASQMQMPGRAGQSMEDMYGFAQRAGNTQYNASQYGNQFQAPSQYQPNQFGNQFQAPQQYRAGQFGYDQVQNQQIDAARLGMAPRTQAAQLGMAPRMRAEQFAQPADVSFERVNAPQLRDLQMQAAGDVGTQSFTQPGAQKQFMDPYMQNVVDTQTREAQRMADRAAVQRKGARAQQGAYGGSAAALENAEANRNLATQLGDIQAKGSQAAYQSGMGQFNTEQQNALQAALANQQVQQQTGVQNLSAALQTQGLGAQTGLTAQQLNQAAGLQSGLANQQTAYNSRLQNAQLRQQAGLANQALQGQYGLQQGQFGQQINLANQALQGQYGLQQGQFEQQAAMQNPQLNMQAQQLNQQARMAAQQAREQSRQFGAGQGMTSAQLAAQYGLAGQQAGEQSRQFGYGQQMQAAGMGAQYGQAANQLNEQSRQYGAGLGLQGLQAGMQGMGQYGNLGSLYNQQQQGIYNFQNQMGAQQQRLHQDILSQQYQDFLNQQRYNKEQLGFMSDLIRGAGMNSSQTTYQAPPPLSSQLAGFGTAAYGASKLMGAKGGQVKHKPSGLSALAISKIG